MKAKLLKQFGFQLVVNSDGRPQWMIPLAELSEAGGEAIAPAQLAEIMALNIEDAQKQLAKLKAKIAKPAVEPAA